MATPLERYTVSSVYFSVRATKKKHWIFWRGMRLSWGILAVVLVVMAPTFLHLLRYGLWLCVSNVTSFCCCFVVVFFVMLSVGLFVFSYMMPLTARWRGGRWS